MSGAETLIAAVPRSRTFLKVAPPRQVVRRRNSSSRHTSRLQNASASAAEMASRAEEHARRQGAHRWRRYSTILRAAAEGSESLSSAIRAIGEESPHTLAYVADVVADRLTLLDPPALSAVEVSATTFASRWRHALRQTVADGVPEARIDAAKLLEAIGEKTDVAVLRTIAKQNRRRPDLTNLGRHLSRRLADRVVVEDQGRVHLRIGRSSPPRVGHPSQSPSDALLPRESARHVVHHGSGAGRAMARPRPRGRR